MYSSDQQLHYNLKAILKQVDSCPVLMFDDRVGNPWTNGFS